MQDPGGSFLHQIDDAQLEALVETMYLVAFADGHYGADERAFFSTSVAALTEGRLNSADFDHIINGLLAELDENGRDRCVQRIKQRLADERVREVALILAHDMAAADGHLHENERDLIMALAEAFNMPPTSTREVFEGPAA